MTIKCKRCGAIVQCDKCNARYKISKYDYDEYKKNIEKN